MANLEFDNSWMKLVVITHGTAHYIISTVSDKKKTPEGYFKPAKLFGLKLVAKVPNANNLKLNKSDGFYIQSDNDFFEIGFVSNDMDKMNEWLLRNKGFSVIAQANGWAFAVTSKPSFSLSGKPIADPMNNDG